MQIILYAIPLFLTLILLELWLDRRQQKGTYQFNDALNSLNLGMMSQVTGVAYKTVQFSFYVLIFQQLAPWSLGTEQLWVYLFAFVAYDFCYYWFHRISHEVNLFWAGHVVHHQSEEYNLTTALRQSSGGFFGFIFYLPLALLGIEPLVLLTVGSLNLVYQFWVHTRHINRMPAWYEYVFVTPSNHRVHHAQNPIYMNKNHGGVFILWDRCFGTFQDELPEEPVIFGITKPLHSWNPVWANLDTYWALLKDAWRTASWRDKVRVFFSKTGWRPADVRKKFPNKVYNPYQQVKFDTPLATSQQMYALFCQFSLIGAVLYFLLTAASLSVPAIWAGALMLVFGLFCLGYYQQQRSGHRLLESCKNVLLAWLACSLFGDTALWPAAIWLLVASSLLLLAGRSGAARWSEQA